jgi:hypothetical protein
MPSRPLRLLPLASLALSAALLALPAHAATILDQKFDDSVRLADQNLRLNGLGLRSVAWFNGFAAGLYLADRQTTPAGVFKTPGAKRLQLRMLVDVPAVEFSKALKKGIRRNTSDAEWPALEARVTQFDRAVVALGTTRKGDVFDLDYLPGKGFVFSANGKPQGPVIPGDEFYDAVLKVFLGERPVDKKLKAALLGAGSAPG